VAAAGLLHRYRRPPPGRPVRVRYWKPIQTGIEQDDDTATVRMLGACGDSDLLNEGIRLTRPLSPHLAARLSGRSIDLPAVVDPVADQPASDRWIVEGAGGVLVPLNDSALMVDLMVRLALPVVVVARTSLGTINHTLLTIEALRARSLVVAGVVMNGASNVENREAIETFGRAAILGELPPIDPLTCGALEEWAAAHLDRSGRLEEYFR
jgi:dethiobiotin synthase